MLSKIKKENLGVVFRKDSLAGMVTSVALIPEVVGFAIIAGIPPLKAIAASIILVIVLSFVGGRPAMVSAAAGSMALVMASLIKNHGLEYMVAASLFTGVIQVLLGIFGIHKLVRYVPESVMKGFVNSLAIIIFISQAQKLAGKNIASYFMVAIAIFLMYLLPKWTTQVPAGLFVIVGMTLFSSMLGAHVQTIGDLGGLEGNLFEFGFPHVPATLDTIITILPYACALALVGLLESLLTQPIIDEMTATNSNSKQEVIGQGIGNTFSSLFGGQAGCAMIGQAIINVTSGGRTRVSTLVTGLSLLFMILLAPSILLQIPTPALIGIMMVVALNTFSFDSFRFVKENSLRDSVVLLVTTILVVVTSNLAIGILVGVALHFGSNLFFRTT